MSSASGTAERFGYRGRGRDVWNEPSQGEPVHRARKHQEAQNCTLRFELFLVAARARGRVGQETATRPSLERWPFESARFCWWTACDGLESARRGCWSGRNPSGRGPGRHQQRRGPAELRGRAVAKGPFLARFIKASATTDQPVDPPKVAHPSTPALPFPPLAFPFSLCAVLVGDLPLLPTATLPRLGTPSAGVFPPCVRPFSTGRRRPLGGISEVEAFLGAQRAPGAAIQVSVLRRARGRSIVLLRCRGRRAKPAGIVLVAPARPLYGLASLSPPSRPSQRDAWRQQPGTV